MGNKDCWPRIGRKIEKRYRETGKPIKLIVSELELIGLEKPHSKQIYMASVFDGKLYGNSSKKGRIANGEVRLYRLSQFLNYLDFKEEDEVVIRVRELYPSFEYPPTEQTKAKLLSNKSEYKRRNQLLKNIKALGRLNSQQLGKLEATLEEIK